MNIAIVTTQRFEYTTLIQDHSTNGYLTNDNLTNDYLTNDDLTTQRS